MIVGSDLKKKLKSKKKKHGVSLLKKITRIKRLTFGKIVVLH
jgi:hypothetical protein